MWLFTPEGFFSIVDKHDPKHPGELCIRARASGDLDRLRKQMPELGETIMHVGTDYPARAWAERSAVAAWASSQMLDLDYSNFKSEVGRTMGHDRAHVYMGVWSQMLKLEKEG